MAPFSDEPSEIDGPAEAEPPPRGNGFLILLWIFLAAAILTNIIAWALGF